MSKASHNDDKTKSYTVFMTPHSYPIDPNDPKRRPIITEEDIQAAKDKHLCLLESVLGSADAAGEAYVGSFTLTNGFGAYLTKTDAQRIAEYPDVIEVERSRTVRMIDTTDHSDSDSDGDGLSLCVELD